SPAQSARGGLQSHRDATPRRCGFAPPARSPSSHEARSSACSDSSRKGFHQSAMQVAQNATWPWPRGGTTGRSWTLRRRRTPSDARGNIVVLVLVIIIIISRMQKEWWPSPSLDHVAPGLGESNARHWVDGVAKESVARGRENPVPQQAHAATVICRP